MGQLAFRFFTWFKRNKSLVIFIYRLASVSASIYLSLIADILYVEIVVHQPALTTQKSPASFPDIEPGFELGRNTYYSLY
jgi:hypothetical protein